MATYKLHKLKYRWLTNAANCLFSRPTTIITQALLVIIADLQAWCKQQSEIYKRFGKSDANLYWVINSMFEFMLNLPRAIHSVYMTDITRC